jgi:hypothetical protein
MRRIFRRREVSCAIKGATTQPLMTGDSVWTGRSCAFLEFESHTQFLSLTGHRGERAILQVFGRLVCNVPSKQYC